MHKGGSHRWRWLCDAAKQQVAPKIRSLPNKHPSSTWLYTVPVPDFPPGDLQKRKPWSKCRLLSNGLPAAAAGA